MDLGPISKILIINLGGMGDLLLSLPALRALRNKYKDALIDIMVVERVSEVVSAFRLFDSIFVYRGPLLYTLRLLLKLRKNKYTVVINMRSMVSSTSALKMRCLLNILGVRLTVGRDTNGYGGFYDIKIPERLPGEKFEMEYDIETVKALGVEAIDPHIDCEVGREAEESLTAILDQAGVGPQAMLIGVHPGGVESHRWPLERFKEVIKALNQRVECVFVITGGKGEEKLGEILKGLPDARIVNLAGKLNFKELCVLIKRCSLFIANDTGPMHIAAIMNTPLIALFGPGYLKRFDPRNISKKAAVISVSTACAPCDKKHCSDLRCLKGITVSEVAAQAGLFLKVKE